MTSNEIRKRFLDFFEKREHAVIPSASLVPENDPSVLFNTAGMQPLVPYLLGQKHPKGDKIVDVQKCMRTNDIEEVGDNTHHTFFEMLGNWSLGSYFKKEAIAWSYEFLTSKEEGLGLDPKRLYITCFEGDENAPKDTKSAEIWMSHGIPEDRIYYLGADDNWWSPGDNGPCGPSSEMFYDVKGGLGDLSFDEFKAADDRQDVVEVWNDVFMEYEKKDGKVVGKLSQKNVDTGAGLERITAVMQEKESAFDTDLFESVMTIIKEIATKKESQRIIADHMRSAVFLVGDGVVPSNTDQGYILRRLIRRSVMQTNGKNIGAKEVEQIATAVIEKHKESYPNIFEKKEDIIKVLTEEIEKFEKTIQKGLKEFEKLSANNISGKEAFVLFSTYGFPLELTEELAKEKQISVDVDGFKKEFEEHQALSRSGAEQKFKGGLADSGEETTMLHTATHLMLAGLRKYLGEHVHQAGSNITAERTRFDFTHPEKVDRETLDKVEAYVNEAISKKCPVVIETMDKEKAKESGVEGSFWERYPDEVNVYSVKCTDGTVYSQELCGGPHVESTEDIKGTFKIKREESVAAGVRRVKAYLT